MAALQSEQTLTYLETAELVNGYLREIHSDPEFDASIVENQLYPSAYGLLNTMHRYDIDELSVAEIDASNPQQALETVFQSAQLEMDQRGVPHPDLALYQNAMDYARTTETPMSEVMANVNAVTPFGIQRELGSDENFSLSPDDTVGAVAAGPAMQTVEQAQAPEVEFSAENYQEYDVHLMAYPLQSVDLPFTDRDLVSRDSHAFLVVTERGADPSNPDNALLVTRGGPDERGFSASTSRSSDENEQSPTNDDKGSDGDVYVSSPEASRLDYDTPNVFHMQTATITGNIGEITDRIADFREFINGEDINYVPTNLFGEGSNSNTYAGDAFELLTDQEPNNPHHGVFSGRRTPALENDLVNYEETEYAPYFD